MTPQRRSANVRAATASDAQAYGSKAHEFLEAAQGSLAIGNNVAAAGNAIHAGIAAAGEIAFWSPAKGSKDGPLGRRIATGGIVFMT